MHSYHILYRYSLKRKEGRRPAILLGLRDSDNDSGTIKVYARKLCVSQSSLTIPVSSDITTEQVIREAVARFRPSWDRSVLQALGLGPSACEPVER